MRTYEYRAIGTDGRQRRGRLKAEGEVEARNALRMRGFAVLDLQSARNDAGKSGRLSSPELALTVRQLSALLAISPAAETLLVLASQSDSRRVRDVLADVHKCVLEGMPLSDAMSRQPRSFSAQVRMLTAAGELSGELPRVLERLADLLERQQEMRAKVTAALVYPAVLASVAAIVIVCLMAFIVPRVVDQFELSGQTLPALTRFVIGLSNFVVDQGWLALLTLCAGVPLCGLLLSNRRFRLRWDTILLSLPILGAFLRQTESGAFARTLATMLSGGLPAPEAIRLAGDSSRNARFRQAGDDMRQLITEGASLSSAFRSAGIFPPVFLHLAASGESSGTLDTMLEKAADYLEREARTASSVFLSLIEPLIILVMGGVVCLIVLSILLPILQINTLSLA